MHTSPLNRNHLAAAIFFHIFFEEAKSGKAVPVSREYYKAFSGRGQCAITSPQTLRKAIEFLVSEELIYDVSKNQLKKPVKIAGSLFRSEVLQYRINKQHTAVQYLVHFQEKKSEKNQLKEPDCLDNEVISNQYSTKQNQKTKNQPDLRRGSASHPHADRQPKPEHVKKEKPEPPPPTDDEAVEMIVQMFGSTSP